MAQINCSHPVIILNPQFKNLIIKYKHLVTPYYTQILTHSQAQKLIYDFPWSKYSRYRTHVTSENIDSYYILDPHTGAIYPMYQLVPCGKCAICRDRKSREWSFRAVCENSVSTSQPIFVTLTYNNEHLPSCGIFKEEIQLFLKRLRRSLDRLKITHNIRYFACGEYGTQSKRPHYHMILWNFPQLQTKYKTLRLIEKAWSLPTGEYKSDGSPITSPIGFAYVLPCEKGGISYVMKYMRKSATPPHGKNPNFFLSSRRNGGIGAAHCRKVTEFHRQNPSVLTMSVLDPWSNQVFESFIPSYFRTKFFPSNSSLAPKIVRDAYHSLLDSLAKRKLYYELLGMPIDFKLTSCYINIIKKWNWLDLPFATSFDYEQESFHYRKTPEWLIREDYQKNEEYLDNAFRILMLHNYDEKYIKKRAQICNERQIQLTRKFLNVKPLDINEYELSIIHKNNSAILKEKL